MRSDKKSKSSQAKRRKNAWRKTEITNNARRKEEITKSTTRKNENTARKDGKKAMQNNAFVTLMPGLASFRY